MEERDPPPEHETRVQLVWDLLVFQGKLLADGVRDILLSPVSIVAGVMGLIAGGDEPDRYLRRVKHFGRRMDRWINLFGDRRYRSGADAWIAPIETRVKKEVHGFIGARRGEGPAAPDTVAPDAQSPADSAQPTDASSNAVDSGGSPWSRNK